MGDILRTIDGELSTVRGVPPEQLSYHGVAAGMPEVWQAVSAAISGVIDHVTLTDLLPGQSRPA